MTRRNVVAFWNAPGGPALRWRCNCGHEGVLDAGGSRAEAVGPSTPAAVSA